MSEKKSNKRLKKLLELIFVLSSIVLAIITYANVKIPRDSDPYIYQTKDSVPENSVAVVLGTARYLGNGLNPYFTYRIKAAKELYDAGKVRAFVVSGDNSHRSYNEPREMRRALVEAGVPDSIIHCDFAGFRTLDSVVRMAEVFGQKKFVVISQKFHNERAIFIARYYDYEAFGYNAADLSLNRASYKTKIREVFARVKVFVDIAMGTQPKFLGEPIDIERTACKKDTSTTSMDSTPTVIEKDSI